MKRLTCIAHIFFNMEHRRNKQFIDFLISFIHYIHKIHFLINDYIRCSFSMNPLYPNDTYTNSVMLNIVSESSWNHCFFVFVQFFLLNDDDECSNLIAISFLSNTKMFCYFVCNSMPNHSRIFFLFFFWFWFSSGTWTLPLFCKKKNWRQNFPTKKKNKIKTNQIYQNEILNNA